MRDRLTEIKTTVKKLRKGAQYVQKRAKELNQQLGAIEASIGALTQDDTDLLDCLEMRNKQISEELVELKQFFAQVRADGQAQG